MYLKHTQEHGTQVGPVGQNRAVVAGCGLLLQATRYFCCCAESVVDLPDHGSVQGPSRNAQRYMQSYLHTLPLIIIISSLTRYSMTLQGHKCKDTPWEYMNHHNSTARHSFMPREGEQQAPGNGNKTASNSMTITIGPKPRISSVKMLEQQRPTLLVGWTAQTTSTAH